ncbi:UvrD-helicase domain-containing protein [Bifidobacterium sp. 64T4]|uniref:UvrD-helicase domain-containing protein n=1 Tax=Bifidobacterium pongonis TaxID=2834432 RepID=UPI001C58D681|nr:UvrD-helicase domain-containing protein [Bifidobacterium pongonis]MBW3094081.1 UvrD-helicase domain-containing protein [Bifidobacterium pongonis]
MGLLQLVRRALLGEDADPEPAAPASPSSPNPSTGNRPRQASQSSSRPNTRSAARPAPRSGRSNTQPGATAASARANRPQATRRTQRQSFSPQSPQSPQSLKRANAYPLSPELAALHRGRNPRSSARLTPQPMADTATIANVRATIGPIEKNDLSDEQISAIAGADRNTLVLAGAGTGKTTTIVGYISWLLKTGKAKPDEILVLSYTKKSADEMSGRISAQTGASIRACTFHSLGLEICRNSTVERRPIVDDASSNKAIAAAFNQLFHGSIPYRLLALKLMPEQVRKKYEQPAESEDFQTQGKDYDLNQYTRHFVEVAGTAIQHMRSNNITIDDMRALNANYGGEHAGRNHEMINLIEPLYAAYMSNLQDRHGIDFPGMIVDAIDCVRNGAYRHNYRYVLIDEYQDMSRPRYRLIRALREQKDFSLFCVGDDWQSIYRFSGSDISLILDFDELWNQWGETRMFQITTTRRFRTSLIEASGEFVMADPNLYVKHLHSTDERKDHSLKALGGQTVEERFDVIVEQLRKLPKKATVMLLGRYRSDVDLILRYDREGLFTRSGDSKFTFRDNPGLDIEFLTAHKSKGLQRDFVFVLCCSGGLKGFPSAIGEEPLLGLLLPEAEEYPNAEERRLFYVAMTRCRKKVFFVVDQARPSRFMYELRDCICPNIFRGVSLPPQCPACGNALQKHRPRNNPDRMFYGCSAYPACTYTRNIS